MVSSEYRSKLARQIERVSSNAQRAAGVYDDIGSLLERYHGGMPVGFLSAIASFESGGKMSSTGDSSLGEVGIFQITSSFPGKVGLDARDRYDKEINIFLGCLEYQMMAVEMFFAAPQIRLGTVDNWKLARLAFAIGAGGTRKLLGQSNARSYRELVDYVDRVGGVPLGRQSAGKVWFRVHVIDVLWDVGRLVRTPFIGAPVRIPNSPAGPYTLPDAIAPYMPSPWRGPLIAAGIGIAGIAALLA